MLGFRGGNEEGELILSIYSPNSQHGLCTENVCCLPDTRLSIFIVFILLLKA